MLTPLVISLASDFIQHIFLIVLVGLTLVEYVKAFSILKTMPPGEEMIKMMKYAKSMRTIFIIVLMATIWFIGEYFFDDKSLIYFLFLRWPLVLLILFYFISFIRKDRFGNIPKIFSIFAVLLVIFILFDIVDYFIDSPFLTILVAFERAIAMLAFFFSFLKYFIVNRITIGI